VAEDENDDDFQEIDQKGRLFEHFSFKGSLLSFNRYHIREGRGWIMG